MIDDITNEQKAALVEALNGSTEEIPWVVYRQLQILSLVRVREGFMRVDESKMWTPEGKLDGRGASSWGTIVLTPAGQLLAMSLKRETERGAGG